MCVAEIPLPLVCICICVGVHREDGRSHVLSLFHSDHVFRISRPCHFKSLPSFAKFQEARVLLQLVPQGRCLDKGQLHTSVAHEVV